MPFFLDKEEYEAGKAKDGGALAKQRQKEGRPVEDNEIGLPYRHAKASVPMLEGQTDYIRVANDDPKIDDIRAKTTRGQGWEKYEEGEKERAARAAEREAKKAAREQEKEQKAAERAAAKEQKAKEKAEAKAKADAEKAAAKVKAEAEKAKETEAAKAEGEGGKKAVTRGK